MTPEKTGVEMEIHGKRYAAERIVWREGVRIIAGPTYWVRVDHQPTKS